MIEARSAVGVLDKCLCDPGIKTNNNIGTNRKITYNKVLILFFIIDKMGTKERTIFQLETEMSFALNIMHIFI